MFIVKKKSTDGKGVDDEIAFQSWEGVVNWAREQAERAAYDMLGRIVVYDTDDGDKTNQSEYGGVSLTGYGGSLRSRWEPELMVSLSVGMRKKCLYCGKVHDGECNFSRGNG